MADKHEWKCPQCLMKFTTFVHLSTPPTCFAHKNGKQYSMVSVDKEKRGPSSISPNGGGGLQGVGEPDPKGDGA